MAGGRVSVSVPSEGAIHDVKALLDGGWNIGRSVQIGPGLMVGETLEEALLEMGGDDALAGPITIFLTSRVIVPVAENIIARVLWGTGGVQAEALLDMVNNTQFTVFGSFVRLLARGFITGAGAAFSVGAFASYGAHPGNIRPRFTESFLADGTFPATVLPGATTGPFNIPTFATDVQLLQGGTSAASVPYSLKIDSVVPAPISEFFYTSTTNSSFERKDGVPAELPNNARQIRVTNRDAVLTLEAPRLLFGLAL